MEGNFFITVLHALLRPASWLAGQIGLPDHLPAVELAVGLVFLACCFGLALHAIYAWLRGKQIVLLVAAVVAIAAGVVGLLSTVSFRFVWLYTLLLAIVAADAYWRLLNHSDLPLALRRGGTMWATAALLLCAGTPSLFLIHTWFIEQRINHTLETRLNSEQQYLVQNEQARITNAVAALAKSSELTADIIKVGNPSLVALVQRMSVQEQLPYLLVLDSKEVVLARSQPVAAFGDTWPVTLNGISTGTASGLALSERDVPLVLSAYPIKVGEVENAFTLVGGSKIDRTYLAGRSSALQATLFLTSDHGLTAIVAPEGNVLNALSSASVDTFLADHTGKVGSFSVASGTKRYLIRTQPLISSNGAVVGTLGTAAEDTSTDFRLRVDLIAMVALAALVLVLPALAWRKKEAK